MYCTTLAWALPGTDPLTNGMWEDRKRLFVDLLQWDIATVDERYEIDQFDTAQAHYLVAVDGPGSHAGSLRLLPSIQPHILSDLFARLCNGPVPRSANIFEITRLCLPPRYPAAQRLDIRNHLISAMIDHALGRGITTLTGVVTANFRKQVLAMGWRAEPLGAVHGIGGAQLGAFAISVDRDTPSLLAAKGIYRPHALLAAQADAELAA